MNITKSLQIFSVVSVLALGTAFAAGCDGGSGGTPGTDGGTTPADDGGGTVDAADAAASSCDFGEPNDTRETAKAIDLNTMYSGLCVSNADQMTDTLDFYEITAPATDLAGGLVQVQISNVQNGGLAEIIVTSSADNQVIFDAYTTDHGASVQGWLAVSPGAKYKVQISRFGGAGDRFAYDLFAKYTAVVDTFEPNNTKATAKPIALNATIAASAVASSANAALADSDSFDFYSVTLAAGVASVKMTTVPSDYLCDVQLLDPSGVKVFENYQVTKGADCTIDATDLVGGMYTVSVSAFGGAPSRGEGGSGGTPTLPAFATQAYHLQVVQ